MSSTGTSVRQTAAPRNTRKTQGIARINNFTTMRFTNPVRERIFRDFVYGDLEIFQIAHNLLVPVRAVSSNLRHEIRVRCSQKQECA